MLHGCVEEPLPLTLYVHMPWCVRKCPYCDFTSHQLKSARPDRELHRCACSAISTEIAVHVRPAASSAVFFGGGTPSLFAPDDFARLLEARFGARCVTRRRCGDHSRGQSGHHRARPFPTATPRCRHLNRVSLGAQTFSSQRLAAARAASIAPEDTGRAVEELHAAGLEQFQSWTSCTRSRNRPLEAGASRTWRMACALRAQSHLVLSTHDRARHRFSTTAAAGPPGPGSALRACRTKCQACSSPRRLRTI